MLDGFRTNIYFNELLALLLKGMLYQDTKINRAIIDNSSNYAFWDGYQLMIQHVAARNSAPVISQTAVILTCGQRAALQQSPAVANGTFLPSRVKANLQSVAK